MLNKKVTHTVKRLKVMGEIQQVSSVGFCREGLQVLQWCSRHSLRGLRARSPWPVALQAIIRSLGFTH